MKSLLLTCANALALYIMAFTAVFSADPVSGGLSATYYSNPDFTGSVASRIDPAIDFMWGTRGPGISAIGTETYSAVWKGQVLPQFSESYTFTTLSDDGVLVWIDGKLLISNWRDHSPAENSATIALVAGKKTNVMVKYYQNKGDSAMRLWWSSTSVPKAIVPSARLFPEPAPSSAVLAVFADDESRTSPAWIFGSASSLATQISATSGTQSINVKRDSSTIWHLTNTSTGPTGIVLTPGAITPFTITEKSVAGTRTVAGSVRWAETDLGNLPYSFESIAVRVGESLLLTVGGAKTKVEIDTAYNGTTFAPIKSGIAGAKFQVSYATPGIYQIRGRRDGIEVGKFKVLVVGIDFLGSTADEIAFQRDKDIAITPAKEAAPLVVFTSSDADGMQVDQTKITSSGASLKILPFIAGKRAVQARLNTADGPIIAEQNVDVFKLITTATSTIVLVETYPDGTQVAQGSLIMTPLVPDLTIVMTTFVSGVTFEDSTTSKTFLSNAFVNKTDGSGEYPYRLLKAPVSHANLCHTFRALQRGVAISR